MPQVSNLARSEQNALMQAVRPGDGLVVGHNKNTGEFGVFRKIDERPEGAFPKGFEFERVCSLADAGSISEALSDGNLVLFDGADCWCRVDIKN